MESQPHLFIAALSLGVMLIGVIGSGIFRKDDKLRVRANAVFILGAAILFLNWIVQEKTLLLTLQENLGLVLLASILTGFKLLV